MRHGFDRHNCSFYGFHLAFLSNPSFGLAEIRTTRCMYALIKISRQELENSAFDLEAFLRDEAAEQFGVLAGLRSCRVMPLANLWDLVCRERRLD